MATRLRDRWKLKWLLSSLLLDLLHCHPICLRAKRSAGKRSTATCLDLQSPPFSTHSLFWLDLRSCCFVTFTSMKTMHSCPDNCVFTCFWVSRLISRENTIRLVASKCTKWKCQDWPLISRKKIRYQSQFIYANYLLIGGYRYVQTKLFAIIHHVFISLSLDLSLYFCLFHLMPPNTCALCHLQSALWVASPTPTCALPSWELWAQRAR